MIYQWFITRRGRYNERLSTPALSVPARDADEAAQIAAGLVAFMFDVSLDWEAYYQSLGGAK